MVKRTLLHLPHLDKVRKAQDLLLRHLEQQKPMGNTMAGMTLQAQKRCGKLHNSVKLVKKQPKEERK